ncbi:sulfotransferase 2B1-like [Brachionichthys hirsutus]|uniref:sulfotransferase 2B1-like n=1 Tax=Brachionichthys hirsutus TaxID=412623 RepID=UPI0036043470
MGETSKLVGLSLYDGARLDVTEMFQGFMFPGLLHTQESLHCAVNFPFQDTDIIIATYPKSGTTWMQQIVTLITSRGDPNIAQTVPNWARAPWLEQIYLKDALEASSLTPRIFTTHLPYQLLSSALQGSKAKVIYVSRNPKDVAVSYYHFHNIASFLPNLATFQEFLHQFLDGKVSYGSWFDHVKDWTSQTATMNNLLHITYEELWQDLRGSIKRLSAFLQCPLEDDEVNNCAKHTVFSVMKENKMVNYTLLPDNIIDHSKGSFMRNGKIGDWKNLFTEEQDQYFKGICESKMKDWPSEFVWEV